MCVCLAVHVCVRGMFVVDSQQVLHKSRENICEDKLKHKSRMKKAKLPKRQQQHQ